MIPDHCLDLRITSELEKYMFQISMGADFWFFNFFQNGGHFPVKFLIFQDFSTKNGCYFVKKLENRKSAPIEMWNIFFSNSEVIFRSKQWSGIKFFPFQGILRKWALKFRSSIGNYRAIKVIGGGPGSKKWHGFILKQILCTFICF